MATCFLRALGRFVYINPCSCFQFSYCKVASALQSILDPDILYIVTSMHTLLTPAVVKDIDQHIGAYVQNQPMTTWLQIVEVLTNAGLAWRSEKVPNANVMTHPLNRGRLGLNAYKAHANGQKIIKVGADPTQLANATAFEMAPSGPRRMEQISFNDTLIGSSEGLLRARTLSEQFLSVSCGHTVAFFRAVDAGARTCVANLADNEGRLRKSDFIKKDPRFKELLLGGWSWLIVSHVVEERWPHLPDIAQRALNASNAVAGEATELETASSIAEWAKSMKQPIDWQQCIDAAAATSSPAERRQRHVTQARPT